MVSVGYWCLLAVLTGGLLIFIIVIIIIIIIIIPVSCSKDA